MYDGSQKQLGKESGHWPETERERVAAATQTEILYDSFGDSCQDDFSPFHFIS
jgi:hypothetical protein